MYVSEEHVKMRNVEGAKKDQHVRRLSFNIIKNFVENRGLVITTSDGQGPVVFGDTAPEAPDANDGEEGEQGFE